MAGKETTGRLALVVNSQTFGWLRNEFLALGWKNRNDEILQGQVQKSSIFCNFFARQTTPTILFTLYPLEICAIRWGPMANIPLQGATRKIKSPHKIQKSPHNWQITMAQHAHKFNQTLWYRSRISSCLCIMSKIRSQNQHSLINWPLAQQVRQSNPLKLLGYLSVLIQEGLHKLA
jgi:hypothetical protein